jgi:hypothetical protein
MIKKTYSKLFWHFDRTFGDSKKWFGQFIWLFSIIFITILSFSVTGCLLYKNCCLASEYNSTDEILNIPQRTIGMILRSNGIDLNSKLPFAWQVILVFVGTFLVSGFVITYIGNLLRNRLDAYRNGSVRYKFSNHILFLGGSKMILPMIKELFKKDEYRKLDFVVLIKAEPQDVRCQIESFLTDEENKQLKITVLRGNRDDRDSLKSVHIDKASRIYIIGEDPNDSERDSTNMESWNLAKELCSNREGVPCFLVFNRASTAFVFRHMEEADQNLCLDTTFVNRLESVAQRVLVHNGNEKNIFPALDREGISKDSERTVHFVLYGMTAISYALSTTAAHLCHFPNFIKRNENDSWGENVERRTRITLIAPKIYDQMANFTSHLNSLFNISKCYFYDDQWKQGEAPKPWDNKSTMDAIGDFLDIEWNFVDGNIADEKIRRLLKKYYEENKEGKAYLTLAMCQKEADKNIAAALYLPTEFHTIEYKDEEKTIIDFEKTIPILVFQPESEEMLKTANSEIRMFKNIFPFGSIKESYDPSIRSRISEGKRIHYIYSRGEDYAFMTSDQDELDQQWRNTKYADQMSNIYSASHIGVKQRSMGNREQLTDEEIQLLAITEHNRWNIEKLLMGFEALPKTEREKQYTPEGLEELRELKKQFKHYCIEPYSELTSTDRIYDTIMVKNLNDVIQRKETVV